MQMCCFTSVSAQSTVYLPQTKHASHLRCISWMRRMQRPEGAEVTPGGEAGPSGDLSRFAGREKKAKFAFAYLVGFHNQECDAKVPVLLRPVTG